MSAQQIFKALLDVDGNAHVMAQAAKAGFLEWAMTLPKGTDACDEALRVLRFFPCGTCDADAAHLFVAYLRDASRPLPTPKRRGGAAAKRRVIH